MRNKVKLSIALSEEQLRWLDERVEKQIFADRTHGVAYCIRRCMDEEKEGRRGEPRS
jgi:Arc/MetJ-type ribon-helix-helix transcriptional regulator